MSGPLVSVSGVRGVVGESFTDELVRRWARAFALRAGAGARVVLARDTRPSGEPALAIAEQVLASAGVQSIVLGVAPTPTAALAVTHHRAAGGLVVTGSHNPAAWNALKFLDGDGVYLSAAEMQTLEKSAAEELESERAVHIARESTSDTEAVRRHVEQVLALPLDLARIRARSFQVVVDPVNGAGALALPSLLEQLGCVVTALHGEPTGNFARPPAPEPQNLATLAQRVRAEGAHLGLACDPDADRLALVGERGEALSEEYTVTFAAASLLDRSDVARGKPVVVNLSTTRMVDDVAARYGCRVVRTPVGERHVVEGMRAHSAEIGGEGNGGVILRSFHEGRDSLVGAALVLDLLARTARPISALISELPSYARRKESFPAPQNWDTADAAADLARAFPEARLSTLDGVRADLPQGWLHLRLSNTEPILRLLGEATSAEILDGWLSRVRQILASPVRATRVGGH